MKRKEEAKDNLRITGQFRLKAGMRYDLRCDGAKLTVVVSPRMNDNDESEWRVDASTQSTDDGALFSRWAPTRREALNEIGREWSAEGAERGLPMFDWEAVATVLSAVRAV